jgi:hypothetical protein
MARSPAPLTTQGALETGITLALEAAAASAAAGAFTDARDHARRALAGMAALRAHCAYRRRMAALDARQGAPAGRRGQG